MGEIYAAAYAWSPRAPSDDGAAMAHWTALFEPALLGPEAANAALQAWPPRCAAGSALAAFSASLVLPPAAIMLPGQADRAQALLRLARAAWQGGPRLPAEQALPVYLRDKVAQTTAERELLREARRGRSEGPVLAQAGP
jgi:tRNA threonylcarbamoyladenosine biosynthesis protein TsaB